MKVLNIILIFLLNLIFTFASEDSTLQLIHVVYRHGDRTPINFYHNDHYSDVETYWPQGLGQLTKKGMAMEYKLGGWLRKRYGYDFINEEYNSEQVHAISTDYDRTLMSANSVLASFYFPKDMDIRFNKSIPWMPTPVHTSKAGDDKVINVDASCPRIVHEVNVVNESPEVKKFNEDRKELYQFLSEKCGDERKSILRVAFLLDTLFIERNNGLLLPDWVTDDLYNKMKEVSDFSFKKNSLSLELKRLRAGPLLRLMAVHMKKKASGELDTKKMYMYSAHDSTVAILLNSMGAFNGLSPPYAATVLVELHKVEAKYFVKLFYRNDTNIEQDAYPIAIAGCEHVCPLEKWHDLLKTVTPEDWDTECYVRDPKKDALLLNIETGLLIGVLLITVLILAANIFARHKRRRDAIEYQLISST